MRNAAKNNVQMAFHTHGGTPLAGWFICWKIPSTMDDLGGTPILGNLHIYVIVIVTLVNQTWLAEKSRN